jgi:hypothetical protein
MRPKAIRGALIVNATGKIAGLPGLRTTLIQILSRQYTNTKQVEITTMTVGDHIDVMSCG